MLAQLSDPTTLDALIKLIPAGGVTGMLIAGIWMVLNGKLILPRELERMKSDRDEWREIAMRSVTNNEALKSTAQDAVDIIKITARAEEPNVGKSGKRVPP